MDGWMFLISYISFSQLTKYVPVFLIHSSSSFLPVHLSLLNLTSSALWQLRNCNQYTSCTQLGDFYHLYLLDRVSDSMRDIVCAVEWLSWQAHLALIHCSIIVLNAVTVQLCTAGSRHTIKCQQHSANCVGICCETRPISSEYKTLDAHTFDAYLWMADSVYVKKK